MRGSLLLRQKPRNRGRLRGFTIVELLIVVVVIAVLAAITIVAYNGITARATDSGLKSDLTTGAKQLQLAKVEDGSFPGSKPSYLGSTIQYTGGGDSFCITASKGSRAFHMTQNGVIQNGACSGHTVGGSGGGNEIAANAPIQSVTSAQCAALPTFDGSNSSAVRTVTDNRGGTTRTYEIAKLADGKCWMLTNLKLGSTSGSITLTPSDSDVVSNFTLPQVTIGGAGEFDLPRAYGPVPGDTGTGATNYGYLYNFSAATAGETRASLPANNAQYSICPANWRLPSGGEGSTDTDFAALDIAFGGTGAYDENGPSQLMWGFTGPLKGTFFGLWSGYTSSFMNQGDGAYGYTFWTKTPIGAEGAYLAGAGTEYTSPDGSGNRSNGWAMRCLLR